MNLNLFPKDLIVELDATGQPYTTTLAVAQAFNKSHRHVLRDTKNLIEALGEISISTLDEIAAEAKELDWLQCIGLVHAGHDNEGVDHHGRSESSPSLRGGVQEADRAVVRERQAVVADQGGVRHPAFHAAALGAGDT